MMDESLPFVSIVMPIRNEADFIGHSLTSILKNDYPSNKMEVIVADGRSTDKTRDIVNRIAEQDSRVRLLDNPGKIVPIGLNTALKASRGEFFIRVDGHCEIPPDFIKKSIKCLLSHPDAWVAGGYWKTVSEGYVGKVTAAATQSRVGVGNAMHRLGNYDGWIDTVPYGAHHRWVLEKIGYFDEQLVRNQDDEFNMRIILAGGKIWLSSSIWSTYYSRGSLKKLWRQYFQYGFWRIRTMQKHKRPATLRQVVPLMLVLSMLVLLIGSFVWRPVLYVLLLEVAMYIALLAAGTLDVCRKAGLRYAPLAPVVFIILHFGYGLGGLWGIVRFILLHGWKMKRGDEFKLSR
jgi:succinoglycan biosynthesis protein ExoA